MKVPNIRVASDSPYTNGVPLLVVAVFTEEVEDRDSVLLSSMQYSHGLNIAAIRTEAFSGKLGEKLVLTPAPSAVIANPPRRVLLVGLGAKDEITVEKFRRAGGHVGQYAKENKISHVSFYVSPQLDYRDYVQAYIEGVALALYKYEHRDTGAPAPLIELFLMEPCSVQQEALGFKQEFLPETVALISAKYLARDFGNTPANLMTPSVLAEKAKNFARSFGFGYKVLGLQEIKLLHMGLLLSVSQGSAEEPKFFHAWYTPQDTDAENPPPKVVLIGKGVSFDAGGISLKPGSKMDEMKYDMCGGAAVIASMITVAEMKPKCEVHFVVPMTENLPDGKATKPGDVVTAMDGQTVEVLNTDAEGRLILADALCYVKEYIKPDGESDVVLDFATLTGAMITSLGHYKTGFFSNNDELAEFIVSETMDSGEALWRMPLVAEMEDELESDFADMANIGNSQTGGSIMGALFLKKFIGEKWNWVHFDIAGTAWLKGKSALSYCPFGATGIMVGTIAAIIKTAFGK